MGLPCRKRVNYRGYAVAVHRRLCYPHVTSAAVVYGGWGYWTNGQRICLTRSRKTLSGDKELVHDEEGCTPMELR